MAARSFPGAFRIALVAALCVVAPAVQTQNSQPQQVGAPDVDANVDIDSQSQVNNDAEAQSGGNVFDFSNSSRNTPPGPSIGAFGGGSCVGPGEGVSGSAPGFSLGYGKSHEDESCQRRNWVQTLIGAAQHMPEQEANALKKAAVEIMMQDKYAGAAFSALGYESAKDRREAAQQQAAPAATRDQQQPAAAPKPAPAKTVGQMASSCTVFVPRGTPAAMARLLKSQGCSLEVQ